MRILVLILFCVVRGLSQDLRSVLHTRYDLLQASNAIEVVVQSDRPYYLAGEEVRFKAYFVNNTGTPLEKNSLVFAVSITDAKGETVVGDVFRYLDQDLYGTLQLPAEVPSDTYYLRVSTLTDQKVMANKPVSIYQSSTDYGKKEEASLTFFPEGGQVVAGYPTRFSFFRTGTREPLNGRIVDPDGMVLDSVSFGKRSGVIVQTFSKPGSYSFVSDWGASYPIANVAGSGTTMALVSESSQDFIEIRKKSSTPLIQTYYLVGYSGIERFYSGEINIPAQTNYQQRLSFDMNMLPVGVSRFVLHDQQGKVISRISVAKGSSPRISVEADKSAYAKRSQAMIQLKAEYEASILDHYSVVIRPASVFNSSPLHPLVEHQLEDAIGKLSPELVYDPNALDVLLLVDENLVLELPDPDSFKPVTLDKYYLKEVKNLRFVESEQNLEEVAMVLGYCLEDRRTITAFDYNGKKYLPFHSAFHTYDVFGDKTFFIYGLDKNGRRLGKMTFDTENTGTYSKPMEEAPITDERVITNIQMRNKRDTINSAFQVAQSQVRTRNSLIKDNPRNVNKEVVLEDYESFKTMQEAFENVVEFVRVRVKQDKKEIMMLERDTWKKYKEAPLMMIDGLPTFNSEHVLNLNPNGVSRIEVINHPSLYDAYGFLGKYGVLVIHLKPGVENPLSLDDNYLILSGLGANIGEQTRSQSDAPDLRPIVVWEPRVQLSDDAEATIDFTVPDHVGRYEVIVQGIHGTSLEYSRTQIEVVAR